MKISKIFHWLYFTVMMLPCVIIPIFAIYTRNENYNSNIEVQVEQNQKVNFNQLKENGKPTSLNTYYGGSATITYVNEMIKLQPTAQYGRLCSPIQRYANHTYIVRADICTASSDYIISGLQINKGDNTWISYSVGSASFKTCSLKFTSVANISDTDSFRVCTDNHTSGWLPSYAKNIMLFDLTEMGLEDISLTDFNTLFDESYYEYTLSKEIIVPIDTITYNDTDVGSQFVYTLYNATDKYFNCTNLFNLEQVWNWVQLNLFGGNAPLMVYIVWQVIVYEFFMDLIFLLYSVFMFVIDFATNCIDRFTGRANR